MTFFNIANHKRLAFFLLALCMGALSACSIDLTKINTLEENQHNSNAEEFIKNFKIFYGNDTLYASTNLKKAFANALDSSYIEASCFSDIQIQAAVTGTDTSGWNPWYIGATIIPFWPFLPIEEEWTFKMSMSIFCNNILVHQFEFIENEHVEGFLYGALRTDLANQATSNMYQKLIERIKFELNQTRQADLNSASDY